MLIHSYTVHRDMFTFMTTVNSVILTYTFPVHGHKLIYRTKKQAFFHAHLYSKLT